MGTKREWRCIEGKYSRLDHISLSLYIWGVPLATEPGISLIILTPMKIFQRNLNRNTFVV
jgi:hypothetical protein